MKLQLSLVFITTLFVSLSLQAAETPQKGKIPDCMGNGFVLPVNNTQILHWKKTTQNQFRERGHILGKVSHLFVDHSGHHHFEVQIGDRPDSTIEVIYNEEFGN